LLLLADPAAQGCAAPGAQLDYDRRALIDMDTPFRKRTAPPYANRGWWFSARAAPYFTSAEVARCGRERRYLIYPTRVDGFKTRRAASTRGETIFRSEDGTRGSETNNRYPVLTRCVSRADARIGGMQDFSRAGCTGSAA